MLSNYTKQLLIGGAVACQVITILLSLNTTTPGQHITALGMLMTLVAILLTTIVFLDVRRQAVPHPPADEEINQQGHDLNKFVTDRERYVKVLDNMIEGVQIIGYDWLYKYLNDAVVSQSGYKREELLGRKFLEMYPNAAGTKLFYTLNECMSSRVPVKFENEFVYPDGTKKYFELSIEPMPEGLFILSMDISDRISMEMERERRVKEAEEILFRISHEIRQPVTSILGVSNVLDNANLSKEDLNMVTSAMKQSAAILDERTTELSSYVSLLGKIAH